jgi:hypothetical protein
MALAMGESALPLLTDPCSARELLSGRRVLSNGIAPHWHNDTLATALRVRSRSLRRFLLSFLR